METTSSTARHFQKVWLIGVSYALIAMLGIYISVYQLTILSISQYFRLATASMGFMIGIQHFGMVVPPLILGVLCAKIGKRKVIITALALIIVGTSLAAGSQQMWLFGIAVFFIGAGFSVSEATLSALMADEYPDESKRHLGFSQAAFSIGALVGPFIAQWLIQTGVNFKDLFLICAFMFALLLIAFFFVRNQNDKGDLTKGTHRGYLKDFFGSKVLLLIGVAIFLYVGVENTIANYADSFFELTLKLPEYSALALGLFWGAMIPSRILFGILKVDDRKSFIVLSSMLCFSLLGLILAHNATLETSLFAACGFFCGPLWPILMGKVAKQNAGSAGPAMNILMSFSALGGALLPFISGIAIKDQRIEVAYIICMIAALIMIAMYSVFSNAVGSRKLKGKQENGDK
jgi:fucose permease